MKYIILIAILTVLTISCKEKSKAFEIRKEPIKLASEYRMTDSIGCEKYDTFLKKWLPCGDTSYVFEEIHKEYSLRYSSWTHKWDTMHPGVTQKPAPTTLQQLLEDSDSRHFTGGEIDTTAPEYDFYRNFNYRSKGYRHSAVDTPHSPEFNVGAIIDYKNSKPYYDSSMDPIWIFRPIIRGMETVGKGHKDSIMFIADTVTHFSSYPKWGGTQPSGDTGESAHRYYDSVPEDVYANHGPIKPRRDTIKWNSHRSSTLALFDSKSDAPYISRFFSDGTYYVSDSNRLIKELYSLLMRNDTLLSNALANYWNLRKRLDPLSQMENAVHCPYKKTSRGKRKK